MIDDVAIDLEKHVERPAKAYAKERGWWVAKFVSPGLNGVPDDILIRNGRVLFIEFKRPGGELRPQQVKRIRDMRAHGAEVHVIDKLGDAYALLK